MVIRMYVAFSPYCIKNSTMTESRKVELLGNPASETPKTAVPSILQEKSLILSASNQIRSQTEIK